MRKSTQYIAKNATSDTSFQREHTVHMKVFIPHIYGLLNTKLQHMVSFFTNFAKPGSSANSINFNKKTIGFSFSRMPAEPPFPGQAEMVILLAGCCEKRKNGESTACSTSAEPAMEKTMFSPLPAENRAAKSVPYSRQVISGALRSGRR